jgi:hypothetical protein
LHFTKDSSNHYPNSFGDVLHLRVTPRNYHLEGNGIEVEVEDGIGVGVGTEVEAEG